MTRYLVASSLLCLFAAGCNSVERFRSAREYERALSDASPTDTTSTSVTATQDSQGREARLISAFYGLDDALPKTADTGIWPGAGGTDGMPVIFSHQIDRATMQAGDFRVTTASGKIGEIVAVTLAPADDRGELRTVLFAGRYGSIEDQPAKVEVVGNVLSIDGSVKRRLYQVTVRLDDGRSIEASPIALGDLGDGDNNHELCLAVAGSPQSVRFPAGHLRDPREDLNPETAIAVRP